jgi:hypothetical protein
VKRLLVAAIILAPAGLSVPAGAAHAAQAPVPNPSNPCVAAIRATFAPHGAAVVNRFVAISYRESRWTPGISNRTTVYSRTRSGARISWGRATGCLQILPRVAQNIGATGDLRDPMVNAQTARTLWLRMGWSPWRVR